MMQRMTKADFPSSLGAFKPVGHVVVVMPDDRSAEAAAAAFRDAGFAPEDVLVFESAEVKQLTGDALATASGGAGFGSEVQLMRQHQAMAHEGGAFVIVYAPDDDKTAQVGDIAKARGARLATKYNRLLIEDLISATD